MLRSSSSARCATLPADVMQATDGSGRRFVEQHPFRTAPAFPDFTRARDAECLDVCCESQACRLGAPGVTGDRIRCSASASSRIRICVTWAKIWSWAAGVMVTCRYASRRTQICARTGAVEWSGAYASAAETKSRARAVRVVRAPSRGRGTSSTRLGARRGEVRAAEGRGGSGWQAGRRD